MKQFGGENAHLNMSMFSFIVDFAAILTIAIFFLLYSFSAGEEEKYDGPMYQYADGSVMNVKDLHRKHA